jgi:hypothetical protein
MDSRRTFHLLGETLTFISPMELRGAAADWIELEPGNVISQLRRDSVALGAAWRALESVHGFKIGPPSEREIVDRLHKNLVDYSAHLVVARAATERDGLRCGIGRVRNKHAPKETVELEGINRPGNPKQVILEKHTTFGEARKWVAPPGHSAHATGCAIDFWFGFKMRQEVQRPDQE